MSNQTETEKTLRDSRAARALELAKKLKEQRESKINTLQQTIRDLALEKFKLKNTINILEKQNAVWDKEIAALNPNDPIQAQQISVKQGYINANNTKIATTTAAIKVKTEQIKTKQADLDKQVAGSAAVATVNNANPSIFDNQNSRINTINNGGGADEWKKGWKYNAPLVSSAYFNSVKGINSSMQGKSVAGLYIDQGNWNDALLAWKNGQGGRGTLQMDRYARSAIIDAQEGFTGELDSTMYGFKFLYNPKEVAMAWGIMDQMDPEYVASGQDAFSAISAGLMSSTVSITVLLNRIEDANYLDGNGNFRTGVNPYPISVPLEDRLEIWEKGTMHDVEYLFRTLNGPRSRFTSNLNGDTADRGWLRPSIVELHLGARMRYRVRVQNLQVSHSIFNERMVPILTSVRLDLGRFNDGPGLTANQKSSASSYGVGGGGYIGSTWYNAEQYAKLKGKTAAVAKPKTRLGR